MHTRWIYRITHHQNLEHILRDGLLITKRSASQNQHFVSIGDKILIQARNETIVPVPPGGVLSDYVPFYFGLRSPMLYQIHNGFEGVQKINQREIVYLVSSLNRLQEIGKPFAFTDGHARHQLTRFFNDIKDLDQLDWSVINSNYWANDENDADRKRKKQAECLVYGDLPLSCIQYILVYDEAMKAYIQHLFDTFANQSIQIRVSADKAYF